MSRGRYMIEASYTSCCFCEKPHPPLGKKTYPFDPRWEFKKAVREFASEYGIKELRFNRSGDHGATGIIHTPCKHQEWQWLRIGWAFA